MKAAFAILLAAFYLLVCGRFGSAQSPQAPSAEKKQAAEPLDINRATAEEFTSLPGIGPELARRIVAYRGKHGPFRRVEDLLAIKGMAVKKWKAIRPFLRVGRAKK